MDVFKVDKTSSTAFFFFLNGIPQLRAMTWKLIPEREVKDGQAPLVAVGLVHLI